MRENTVPEWNSRKQINNQKAFGYHLNDMLKVCHASEHIKIFCDEKRRVIRKKINNIQQC
jgi:hypothetical protein